MPLEHQLQAVAPDAIVQEQMRDVLRNRVSRQALLCHDAVALQTSPDPSRLSGLYLEGRLRAADPNAAIESSTVDNFVAPGGVSVATSVPVVKAALAQLGAAWPGYVLFDDLVTQSCRRVAGVTGSDAADVERLKQNLLQCCTAGVVKLHGSRPAFVPEPSARPAISPLARRQAARGTVMTNRRHELVQLDAFDRHLFALLDGTRSVGQLVEHLAASAAAGQMMAVENDQPVPPERLHQFLSDAVAQSLKRLAQQAFLVA
jgi:methyltransferase-like protein